MYRVIRDRASWALLPCSRILFAKNKVSLDDIRKQWKDGTVVVLKNIANGKFLFAAGSGSGGYAKVGQYQTAHHDQDRYSLGEFIVVNEVVYTETKETFAVPPDASNWPGKANICVFK